MRDRLKLRCSRHDFPEEASFWESITESQSPISACSNTTDANSEEVQG